METWKTYEEVAAYLLNQFATKFGLERVEGKQAVSGQRSGTTWEIDGKGLHKGDQGFVIVECRRYTTSKQNQEKVGGLAYRIIDTGAAGGIIVSPLGLQEGAEKVAAAENITDVRLNENCNQFEYVMSFLKNVMIGAQVHADGELSKTVAKQLGGGVQAEGSLSMRVIRRTGKPAEPNAAADPTACGGSGVDGP